MDQQQLLAAYGVLKNQSSSLELQQKIVDSNNQIIDSHNQILESNNQLLTAQKEAEKKAILGKFTDLLMEGVASDYEDPVFRRKIGLFLSSAAGSSYKGAVLEQITNVAPSLFPVWIEAYKDLPLQESYDDLEYRHPIEIAGDYYLRGHNNIEPNPKLGFEWHKHGAKLNLVGSLMSLSYAYLKGNYSCEINYTECEKWSQLLAKADCHVGTIIQAELYLKGLGRTRDPQKAKKILEEGLAKYAGSDSGTNAWAKSEISQVLAQLDEAWSIGSEDERYIVYQMCLFGNNFETGCIWDVLDPEKYINFHRRYLQVLKERKEDPKNVINYLTRSLAYCPESKRKDDIFAEFESIKSEERRKQVKKDILTTLLALGGLILVISVSVAVLKFSN